MLRINKTTNVYGSSAINTEEGGGTVVVQMSASINDESKGSVSINTSIIDTEAYFANKEGIDEDIKEFNNHIYSLISN